MSGYPKSHSESGADNASNSSAEWLPLDEIGEMIQETSQRLSELQANVAEGKEKTIWVPQAKNIWKVESWEVSPETKGHIRIKVDLPIFDKAGNKVGTIMRHPFIMQYDPNAKSYAPSQDKHPDHYTRTVVIPASLVNAYIQKHKVDTPEPLPTKPKPPSGSSTPETTSATWNFPFKFEKGNLSPQKTTELVEALESIEELLKMLGVVNVEVLKPATRSRRVNFFAGVRFRFKDKPAKTVTLYTGSIETNTDALARQIMDELDSPELFESRYQQERSELLNIASDSLLVISNRRIPSSALDVDKVEEFLDEMAKKSNNETFDQFSERIQKRFQQIRHNAQTFIQSDGDHSWKELMKMQGVPVEGMDFYDSVMMERLRQHHVHVVRPEIQRQKEAWEKISNIRDNLAQAFNSPAVQKLLRDKGITAVGHTETYATVRSFNRNIPVKLEDYVPAWDNLHRSPTRAEFKATMADGSQKKFFVLLASGEYQEGSQLDSPTKLAHRIQEALASLGESTPSGVDTMPSPPADDVSEPMPVPPDEDEPMPPPPIDEPFGDDPEGIAMKEIMEDRELRKKVVLGYIRNLFPEQDFDWGKPILIHGIEFHHETLDPTDPRQDDDGHNFWDGGGVSMLQGTLDFWAKDYKGIHWGMKTDGQVNYPDVLDGDTIGMGARELIEEATLKLMMADIDLREARGETVLLPALANPAEAYMRANPDLDFFDHGADRIDITDILRGTRFEPKRDDTYLQRQQDGIYRQLRHPRTPAVEYKIRSRIKYWDWCQRNRSDYLAERPLEAAMWNTLENDPNNPQDDYDILNAIIERTMGVTLPLGKNYWELNQFLVRATNDPHAKILPLSLGTVYGKDKPPIEPPVEDGEFVLMDINNFSIPDLRKDDSPTPAKKPATRPKRWWEEYQGQGKTLLIDLRDNGGGSALLSQIISDWGIEDGTLSNGLLTAFQTAEDDPDYVEMEDVFPEIVILTNGGTASASELLLHNLMKHHPNVKLAGEDIRTYGKYTAMIPFSLGDDYTIICTNSLWRIDTEGVGETVDYLVDVDPSLNVPDGTDPFVEQVKQRIRSGEIKYDRPAGVEPAFFRAFDDKFEHQVRFDWARENCPNLFSAGKTQFAEQFMTLIDSTNTFWMNTGNARFYQLTQSDLQLLNEVIPKLSRSRNIIEPIFERRYPDSTDEYLSSIKKITGYAFSAFGDRQEFFYIGDFFRYLRSPHRSTGPSPRLT